MPFRENSTRKIKTAQKIKRYSYLSLSGEMLIMLSLPHRLHLIGKSLISVVGSNHNTVCLLHTGQKKRFWLLFVPSFCKTFCNVIHLKLICHSVRQNKKSRHHNRSNDYWAQALRRRRRLNFKTSFIVKQKRLVAIIYESSTSVNC